MNAPSPKPLPRGEGNLFGRYEVPSLLMGEGKGGGEERGDLCPNCLNRRKSME